MVAPVHVVRTATDHNQGNQAENHGGDDKRDAALFLADATYGARFG